MRMSLDEMQKIAERMKALSDDVVKAIERHGLATEPNYAIGALGSIIGSICLSTSKPLTTLNIGVSSALGIMSEAIQTTETQDAR